MAEAFRKIQIGKESTRGTAVAATKKLIGTLSLTPTLNWHRPVDERSSLAEFRRAVKVAQSATLQYEADATHEQLIYLLASAVKGAVTPTTPSGGVLTRDWTFTPNLSSKNVQDSYTWEYGDDDEMFETAFTLINNLEIAIPLNDVVTVRADMFSRFPVQTAFTGSLSDPTVTEIIGNNMKFYIDGTWANLGTTEKASLQMGATIRLPTGLVPVKKADGSMDFSGISEQRRHAELELDLVLGADAVTEYDAWVAGTTRAIRLKLTGAVIEGSLNYEFEFSIIGKYMTEPTVFGSRDGEDLYRLVLASHEDASGNEFQFRVRNKETSLG